MKKVIGIGVALVAGAGIYFGGDFITKTDKPQKVEATQVTVSDKEDIQYKMMNAVDFYSSAEGSFTLKNDRRHANYTVDYAVSLGANPTGTVKTADQGVPRSLENFSNDKTTTVFYKTRSVDVMDTIPISQTVAKARTISKTPSDAASQILARYEVLSDGELAAIYRKENLIMSRASESLFPQELAMNYLKDYKNWEIGETVKMNGLDAVTINGVFDAGFKEKYDGIDKFELYVAKDTGILLGYKLLEGTDVIETLVTHNIVLNKPVTTTNYDPAAVSTFKQM
ncbi:hypothetical protein [Bacillus massiliigorillae]|uniref:hypothetical protein n=1 Tax=Bacillus massiliigorillae TaxID=1243664 RepID=UPI0003A15B9E|nr:hypothetical protein [Bacillus massiliigorillae]